VEKAAWKLLKNISTNCLENHKAKTIAIRWPIFTTLKSMGYNTYLKVQSVFFPESRGSERWTRRPISQGISTMDELCHGKLSTSVLIDYCWTLRREFPRAKYSRKSSTVPF
jgi:hypothetical protein